MTIPTTLDEAVALKALQLTRMGSGKHVCNRHQWCHAGVCGQCAIEHFGGRPSVPPRQGYPNTFPLAAAMATPVVLAQQVPQSLSEALALEAKQGGGITQKQVTGQCPRHGWSHDGICGSCAVEHFGGVLRYSSVDPKHPNTFTPLVGAPVPPVPTALSTFVPPRDAAEAAALAKWQFTSLPSPKGTPRCSRHANLIGGWPYAPGTVCGQCACEHYGVEPWEGPSTGLRTDASVPNMFAALAGTRRARSTAKAADPAPEAAEAWRAWQHNVPGECACGIPRSACTYHFAPSLRPLSPEARERQALRERLEALR